MCENSIFSIIMFRKVVHFIAIYNLSEHNFTEFLVVWPFLPKIDQICHFFDIFDLNSKWMWLFWISTFWNIFAHSRSYNFAKDSFAKFETVLELQTWEKVHFPKKSILWALCWFRAIKLPEIAIKWLRYVQKSYVILLGVHFYRSK